jgi:hypothetical protein
MSCQGDNYDVNNNPNDGCERAHGSTPGHSQGSATARGNTDCNDGDSQDTITGVILSDSRVHSPGVTGFNTTVGAAPDWWSRYDQGNPSCFLCFCTDDYSITFTTSGGGNTPCYQLTFYTDNTTNSVTVTGNGSATMSGGSGSYTDGSTVYFEVQKICSLPVQEAVNYAISYHL